MVTNEFVVIMAGYRRTQAGMSSSPMIEWVPLPEVKLHESKTWYSSCETTPLSGHNLIHSYSSPAITNKHQPLKTPASNLTILSVDSSSTVLSGKTTEPRPPMSSVSSSEGPPIINPSQLDPAHLDQLWKRFLETVVISGNKQSGCDCNCHMTKPQFNVEAVKPSTFNISPPQVSSHHYRSEKPVWPDTNALPNDTPTPMYTPHPQSTQSRPHTTPNASYVYDRNTETHSPNPPCVTRDTQTTPPRGHISITVAPGYPSSPAAINTTADSSNTLERLTLQEACYLMRKDFIVNSRKRQDTIKEKTIDRTRNEQRRLLPRQLLPATPTTNNPSSEPQFRPMVAVKRPKLTFKEMYQQSRKNWNNLPEVREREIREKREREGATNRLRSKIYQKEVLNRMRRINTKKQKRQTGYMKCVK